MGFTQLLLLLLARAVLAEQVFEDSPALTSLWQATSSGSTEAFVSQLIQNREYAQHRSADGRGPLFWSYEFKNMDTLALLMHLSVSLDQEDVEGSKASTFFAGSAEELAEFEADAKAKVGELATFLTEREEEFYAYQQGASDTDDDYEEDEEDSEAGTTKSKLAVDLIDYADDEDDEDVKDEM